MGNVLIVDRMWNRVAKDRMMNYKKLIPSDSFIGRYLDYLSNIETPEAYDFWCAMWALGVRVGKGMYVNRPHSPVFCNWYIILAAESGTTRKSTAVNAISDLIKTAELDEIVTGKTSPEALEIMLHEKTQEKLTYHLLLQNWQLY